MVAALILTACGGVSKTVDMNYGESYKIEEEKLEGKNDIVWESEDDSMHRRTVQNLKGVLMF